MAPQNTHWRVTGKRVVYRDPWIEVVVVDVVLPSGKTYAYTTVHRVPGAAVVCLVDHKLLLLSEYRYPLDDVTYQLPGGLRGPGETAEAAARREFIEETGHQPGALVYLGEVEDNPGLMHGRTTLFYTLSATPIGPPQLDDTEHLEIAWIELDTLVEAIRRGRISDRIVLAAWAYITTGAVPT